RVSFVFFFSSRRRHTRFDCDWSSDVCSSDLSAGDQSCDSFFERPSSSLSPAPRCSRATSATHPGGFRCWSYAACPPRPRERARRSEERRVGKECRSGGSPGGERKKTEMRVWY